MDDKKICDKLEIEKEEIFKNGIISRMKNGARFHHKNCDKFLLLERQPERVIKLTL